MKIDNEKISNIITEEIQKSDLLNFIKKDKDFEKRVKEISSEVVTELVRVLWQHNAIFKNLSR